MDKIQLLQERKAALAQAGKEIRAQINELVDEKSFVELSAFSFSKNEFFNEEVAGEGVVTGFATVDGYPFYVVAQDFKAFNGGVTKANCEKIVKCLDAAEKNSTPVIYLLSSRGVQVGEGVTVLEGLGKLLRRVAQLKGVVPQYAIVNGDLFGSTAMITAGVDFTFFLEGKSVLALNSPFVLSAKSGKNVSKEEIAGVKALDKTGLGILQVENFAQAKATIIKLNGLLSVPVIDAELNASIPALNAIAKGADILSVFEEYVEIAPVCAPEVKTVVGRIGGISVAALIFDGGADGVELTCSNMAKIRSFTNFAYENGLPFVSFANVKGIAPCACTNNSRVMKEVVEYLELLDLLDMGKISVVYNKAIGLGYSLFASKSIGFDYTCAFATAKIALFDDVQGAMIELGGENIDKEALTKRYAEENSDPINAAKDGYIDAIIEPEFVKQYLIAALQMLIK